MSEEKKRELYAAYSEAGYKLKVYDYPMMQTAGTKRYLRDFDIEELLFRKPIAVADDKTGAFYRDKVILITGGGGSIGSELCRQLAKMEPKHRCSKQNAYDFLMKASEIAPVVMSLGNHELYLTEEDM
ncbi:MAG: polysaccharide biosynthesis protein [Clostridiales bacterium]|nr:polysaccharide biosynthesis protein [Clostridiales bacterium]